MSVQFRPRKKKAAAAFAAGAAAVLAAALVCLCVVLTLAVQKTMPILEREAADMVKKDFLTALIGNTQTQLTQGQLNTLADTYAAQAGYTAPLGIELQDDGKVYLWTQVKKYGLTMDCCVQTAFSYDEQLGIIELQVEQVYLGKLKVPKDRALQSLRQAGLQVQGDTVYLDISKSFTATVSGMEITVSLTQIDVYKGGVTIKPYSAQDLISSIFSFFTGDTGE